MRQKRSRANQAGEALVGVIADAASSYGRHILRGVLQYANLKRRWRLHVELRPRTETLEHWPQCDGAILAGGVAGGGTITFDFVRTRATHVINCSGAADPALSPVVSLDDVAAGEFAGEHLMDCQLKRFGFYGLSRRRHVAAPRLEGFRRALERNGFDVIECPVPIPSELDRLTQVHWPRLIDWLRELPEPIGIMATEDGVAHDLAAACLEAKIRVPDRIAIIGVNNDDLLCEGAWPPLSSVEPDYTRVGFEAAALLDHLLRNEEVPPDERVIRLPPVGVVKRLSTSVLAVQNPALAEAVGYIREHACDPCSVNDVLQHVAVGRRWLERQFVAQLGRTPHDEMIRVRVDTAKRLLLRRELGLMEVAQRCGFSPVQFTRTFRHVTGSTPGAYRRAALRGHPRS